MGDPPANGQVKERERYTVQRERTDPNNGQPHVAGVCQQPRITASLKALIRTFMHPNRIQSEPLGRPGCLHPLLPPIAAQTVQLWEEIPQETLSVVSSGACPLTGGSAFREVETKHTTVVHSEDLGGGRISL